MSRFLAWRRFQNNYRVKPTDSEKNSHDYVASLALAKSANLDQIVRLDGQIHSHPYRDSNYWTFVVLGLNSNFAREAEVSQRRSQRIHYGDWIFDVAT